MVSQRSVRIHYVDFEYGVARAVQFDDGIDCFYVDENIDAFLEDCVERINQKEWKE